MSQYLLLPYYNKLNSHLPAVYCYGVDYMNCCIYISIQDVKWNNNNTNVLYENNGWFYCMKNLSKLQIYKKYANPQNPTLSSLFNY